MARVSTDGILLILCCRMGHSPKARHKPLAGNFKKVALARASAAPPAGDYKPVRRREVHEPVPIKRLATLASACPRQLRSPRLA